MRTLKPFLRLLAAAPLAAGALPAVADDISVSGFGTLGYAVSNRPYIYQRFIDDRGTLNRDSVFAVQVDARIAPRFTATAQLKLAPDTADDSRDESGHQRRAGRVGDAQRQRQGDQEHHQ